MPNILFKPGPGLGGASTALMVTVNLLLAGTVHSGDSISGVALFPDEFNEPVTRDNFPPEDPMSSNARIFPGANVASDSYVVFECSFNGKGYYVAAGRVLDLLAGGITVLWYNIAV